MSSWTDGYNSEIGYTSSFFNELTPRWLATICALQGQHAPDITKPFTYCELGCGQGFGAALTASSYPHAQFWAVDFNPSQIANASRLASRAGLGNIHFLEESFQHLADTSADLLPKLDFIVLHGIYSWVNRENQLAIIKIIQRFLKPGGVVYLSYNSHPGWSSFQALRKVIKLLSHHGGASSPDAQATAGLQFLACLKDKDTKAFAAHPRWASMLDSLQKQQGAYLAHELMHDHWHVHHSADVALDMAQAKLNFICSAHIEDNLPEVSLPPKTVALLNNISDPLLSETVKDIARNQNFRRDIFVRGAVPLAPIAHAKKLDSLVFGAICPRPAGAIKFNTPLGEAVGNAALYLPLFDAIAKGASIAQLATIDVWKTFPKKELLQAVALLMAGTYVHPLGDEGLQNPWDSLTGRSCNAFNRATLESVFMGADYHNLAVPACGTGVPASDDEMALVLALFDNPEQRGVELAQAAWQHLERSNKNLVRDDKVLQGPEQNVAEMTMRAKAFQVQKLPVWKALGVLP